MGSREGSLARKSKSSRVALDLTMFMNFLELALAIQKQFQISKVSRHSNL